MNRKYSNKTLDEMARFIDRYFTHTEINSLFLYSSVPDNFDYGTNKLARCLNVFQQLSRSPETEHTHIIEEIFSEVVKRRQEIFEPSNEFYAKQNEHAQSFIRALRVDGYEILEDRIIPTDSLESELTTEISILERKLHKCEMFDVVKTLDQAHHNFVEGNFEACNAMLRTSLEGALRHIANKIAGGQDKIPVNNARFGATPADIRRYLHNQGFFEDDEIKYIKEFYGYTSTDGSHPGISNESESRLRRLMIVALIQYCLEKIESMSL